MQAVPAKLGLQSPSGKDGGPPAAPLLSGDSIAARLLRIIFFCYFIVTVVVTLVQLAAEYKHTKERLVLEIRAMQQTFGPGIADAMWRFNDDILRGILTGMSELPVVAGIKVADDHGKLVRAVGTVLDQGVKVHAEADGHLKPEPASVGLFAEIFSQDFPIVYNDENGQSRVIGTWTVYSNQRIIVKQVEYGFFLILVNSVIKTCALWFIFLFVVRRYLGQPLRQLSQFVGQLNIDNLGDRVFVLNDRGHHELHLLTNKLNEMIANIKASVAENEQLYRQLQVEQTATRQLNESLERRVAERTADLVTANKDLARAIDTLRIAQEELVNSEKLAALGSLVAGVAHELNTPIGNGLLAATVLTDKTRQFASDYATGLTRRTTEAYISDMTQITELVVRNIARSADLVTSFKQVAVDQTSSQRRHFQLAEVVAENIKALLPTINKTAYVIEQAVPEALAMDSYPGPIGQVLINLINNAIVHGFAGRSKGTITIAASAAEDGWLELRVSDDGVGIAAEHLGRIYDPFFTTKLGAGSSGLGLNISHNIVTGLLGGKIRATSQVGGGTTFALHLPLMAPRHDELPAAVEAWN
ncbi:MULTISPECIES: sensor histidine kinase [unclassified Duganella]|uniref:sensor histidine kinase n=1 Tax=unclassified Duganella TaxID=2636909 RepID=UPI000E341C54|nr:MULTISPECIES: ATP-binding protein [unclassified Duganella]RFP15735.1 two-component sensor histidine kinase [Duganella sp. BJB475]RFP33100.1 two-component sensor histidine kinase [Duganella sp. BJB476]